MNLDPELPPDPSKGSVKRNFDEEMSLLKSQLSKLPPDQKLPDLPLKEDVLNEVTEYVRSLGLKVPPTPPTTIGVGGEFVDPSKLKEGRVGMHRDQHVVAFLYRYPDKVLRTLVVYPRDGVDIRTLAIAIVTGRVADVPSSLVQTEIVGSQEFFKICAYDVSELLDIGALELFKRSFTLQINQEMDAKLQDLGRLTRSVDRLTDDNKALIDELNTAKESETRYHNSSQFWKLTTAVLVTVAVLLKVFSVL